MLLHLLYSGIVRARKFDKKKYNVAKIRIKRSRWRRKFRIETKLMLNRKRREYFNNYIQWSTSALHLNILSDCQTMLHRCISYSCVKFTNLQTTVKWNVILCIAHSIHITLFTQIHSELYGTCMNFILNSLRHLLRLSYFHFFLHIFFTSITNYIII